MNPKKKPQRISNTSRMNPKGCSKKSLNKSAKT
jgi:hypothetical protein